MDRRLFLLSTFALAGCSGDPPRQTVICDPGLGAILARAGAFYGEAGVLVLNEVRAEALLEMAEHEASALVATRQSLLANRLQRLGHVRLEHRWQARGGDEMVQLLVTKGGGAAWGPWGEGSAPAGALGRAPLAARGAGALRAPSWTKVPPEQECSSR